MAQDDRNPYAVRAGARIRLRRQDLDLTQKEVAVLAGWGEEGSSRIANYEQGTRAIDMQEAEILGKALGVSPAFLMGFQLSGEDDKDLLAIAADLAMLGPNGLKFIKGQLAIAKEHFANEARADTGRSPPAEAESNAGPQNSGAPAPGRVSTGKRRR